MLSAAADVESRAVLAQEHSGTTAKRRSSQLLRQHLPNCLHRLASRRRGLRLCYRSLSLMGLRAFRAILVACNGLHAGRYYRPLLATGPLTTLFRPP